MGPFCLAWKYMHNSNSYMQSQLEQYGPLMHMLMTTCSCAFFDVEVVVDGSVIEIGSVLSDKYTLTKLWADIINICWDTPIRYASTKEYKVMLPWSSEYQNLFNDNDMQDAFQKLREKGYRWARFIVNTSVGLKLAYKSSEHLINSNDASKDFSTPANQVSVNLNLEPNMDWFDFADGEVLAKFHARNSNAHPENTVLENEIPPSRFDDTENVAKYLGNVVVEPSDDESDGSGDDESNHGLDDYRSGDESGEESDNESDEPAWARYEASSGGFEFIADGENVIL